MVIRGYVIDKVERPLEIVGREGETVDFDACK